MRTPFPMTRTTEDEGGVMSRTYCGQKGGHGRGQDDEKERIGQKEESVTG